MKDYLDCLYTYVMEHRISTSIKDFKDYQTCLQKYRDAYQKIEETLTEEQLGYFCELSEARNSLDGLEDKWLFAEAVALGKWMAR